jgi:teichuronic acid biosynthesis glycosyltransferase TuaC
MTEIAWLTSAYPWSGNTFSGIFFRSQVRALERAGADLTVVAPMPAAPWPLAHLGERWRVRSLAPRDEWDGPIRVVRPSYLNVPGEPGWAQPDRFIADAAWRRRTDWSGGARLIHGHYSLVGLAASRLAHRVGVPFVLTFHGSDLNTWPSRHADRLEDLRRAVREAAAVFAVSGALVTRLRELTGAEAVHLPIGIDHGAVDASVLPKSAARQALGLSTEGVIALFVGHLVKEKGVREFVSAILGLGDPFVGVLVGAGPESGWGTSDPGARGRIQYAGLRAPDDVLRFMAAADVLVLPSYGEGLPTVLVEAGSVGLPVVGSAVGGIPELLAEGRGTVLPEVSKEAVAGALARFNAGRDAAAVAAKRLQAHVRAEYDVDINAARLLQHYMAIDGAIGGHARARSA